MFVVEARNFPRSYAHVNGVHRIRCSPLNIAHRELLISGFPRPRSLREIVHRASRALQVFACLDRNTDGALRVSSAYRRQDPSERAQDTYRLGMALAGVVADAVLSVPRVFHLSRYLPNPFHGQRGDLCGPDATGRWHVLEAKGRNGVLEPGLAAHAKQQATSVPTIQVAGSTVAFATQCACLSNVSTAPIHVDLEDPPDGSSGGRPPSLSYEALLGDYFAILEVLAEEAADGFGPPPLARSVPLDVVGAWIPTTRAWLGVHRFLWEATGNWIRRIQSTQEDWRNEVANSPVKPPSSDDRSDNVDQGAAFERPDQTVSVGADQTVLLVRS
jgi:hypothetical protein